MSNLKIGIDIDGVLYPWHEIVYREIGEDTGLSFNDFWVNYIPSMSEDRQKYIVSIPLYYERALLSEDARTYLPRLAELGELFFITARDISLQRITEKFLNKNKVPFKENLFLEKDKGYLARMLQLNYFVDDFISNYDSVGKTAKAFLFAQPWNRSERGNRDTIYSIKDLYESIKGEIQ